jgi:hypothetical protein
MPKLIKRGYDGKTDEQIRRHEMLVREVPGYYDCAFLDEYMSDPPRSKCERSQTSHKVMTEQERSDTIRMLDQLIDENRVLALINYCLIGISIAMALGVLVYGAIDAF